MHFSTVSEVARQLGFNPPRNLGCVLHGAEYRQHNAYGGIL